MVVPDTGSLIVLFMVAAFLFPVYLFFRSGESSMEESPEEKISDRRRAFIEGTSDGFNGSTTSGKNTTTQSPSKDQPKREIGGGEESTSENLAGDIQSNENASSGMDTTASLAEGTGNNWRCACEGGFLPPGLLQSFGSAEAVIRMSSGQCYHKKM